MLIHFTPPYRADNMLEIGRLTGIHHLQVKNYVSVDLIKAIVNLRSVKDEYEIREIETAVDVAYDMHTTSMKMAMPGIIEQKIAGTIEGIAIATSSILCSSQIWPSCSTVPRTGMS